MRSALAENPFVGSTGLGRDAYSPTATTFIRRCWSRACPDACLDRVHYVRPRQHRVTTFETSAAPSTVFLQTPQPPVLRRLFWRHPLHLTTPESNLRLLGCSRSRLPPALRRDMSFAPAIRLKRMVSKLRSIKHSIFRCVTFTRRTEAGAAWSACVPQLYGLHYSRPAARDFLKTRFLVPFASVLCLLRGPVACWYGMTLPHRQRQHLPRP